MCQAFRYPCPLLNPRSHPELGCWLKGVEFPTSLLLSSHKTASTSLPGNCSLILFQFSHTLKEEALCHFREETFSPSTCFSFLSQEERAEKIELWESSGRQLWFRPPAVIQLQRDRKVKGSMYNRRLFTWLGGGDDQPLIKHRLPDMPLGLAC